MSERITDVAVAIFLKPDGTFLLASRPDGKPYPGYWEFPGGKIEPGESVREALQRELVEELNVRIQSASPWFTFIMRYTHATVRLHCWRVLDWEGDMHGMEGQAFAWQSIDAITVQPTLPGCVPIFRALGLPTCLWISNAGEMGVEAYLGALEGALGRGAAIVQIREKEFAPGSLRRFAEDVMLRCRRFGVRVVVNDDAALAMAIGAAGVHLPARRLAQLPHRPDLPLVGASAHSREEIERAAALGCDYCVLGPVKPTPSHPGAPGLGWERFADMVVDAPVPVFALGGLVPGDLARAQAAGAHGIAMQRGLTAALPAAGIAAATAAAKLA